MSALNYPSDTFHATVDELVEKLENGAYPQDMNCPFADLI